MDLDIRKVRPLRDDVVLCVKYERDITKSVIYFEEDVESKTNQYFEVIRVGPDVNMVSEGDVVLCSWMRITPPENGLLDGVKRKYGLTSQKEILAVLTSE